MSLAIEYKSLWATAKLPVRMTEDSAGFDLFAHLPDQDVVLVSGARALIRLGFAMSMTPGFEAQIRPRSGLALKHGVTVLNSPGTIDADFRGEIGVVLINHHPTDAFRVKHLDRIAQMVFMKLPEIYCISTVQTLSETDRGSGGFGSTGK